MRSSTECSRAQHTGCESTNGVHPWMSVPTGTQRDSASVVGSFQLVGPALMNDSPDATPRPQTEQVPMSSMCVSLPQGLGLFMHSAFREAAPIEACLLSRVIFGRAGLAPWRGGARGVVFVVVRE